MVSSLKTMMTFQIPFIYVHMLAFMIHFVNVMTAIGTGVRVGLLLATATAMAAKCCPRPAACCLLAVSSCFLLDPYAFMAAYLRRTNAQRQEIGRAHV